MAERRGFIDVPGQGFVRKNTDGSYEHYDPSQPYELPPLDEREGGLQAAGTAKNFFLKIFAFLWQFSTLRC